MNWHGVQMNIIQVEIFCMAREGSKAHIENNGHIWYMGAIAQTLL